MEITKVISWVTRKIEVKEANTRSEAQPTRTVFVYAELLVTLIVFWSWRVKVLPSSLLFGRVKKSSTKTAEQQYCMHCNLRANYERKVVSCDYVRVFSTLVFGPRVD